MRAWATFTEEMSSSSKTSLFPLTMVADKNYPDLIEICNETAIPLQACPSCGQGKSIFDLEPFLITFSYNERMSRSVPVSNAEKEEEKFLKLMRTLFKSRVTSLEPIIFFRFLHELNCEFLKVNEDEKYVIGDGKIYRSKYVKLKLERNILRVYLKIDPQSVQKFETMDEACVKKVLESAEESYFKHGTVAEAEDLRKYDNMVGDTSEFSEYEVPPGFALTLRDFQKRNLGWMCAIEDPTESDANTIYHAFLPRSWGDKAQIRIADTPYYADLGKDVLTINPSIKPSPKIKLKGGVLLDTPGSGKKITALALIHSRPPPLIGSTANTDGLKKCPATLIICPQNNYYQWIEEIEKCKSTFKIYCVPDKNHSCDERMSMKITSENLSDIDIVLVTYKYCDQFYEGGLFNGIQFYRIILDEYEESKFFWSSLHDLRADFVWALGSEKLENNNTLYFPKNIRDLFSENRVAKYEISKKYYKQNLISAYSRPQISSTIRVKLTEREKELVESKFNFSKNPKKLPSPQRYFQFMGFILDPKNFWQKQQKIAELQQNMEGISDSASESADHDLKPTIDDEESMQCLICDGNMTKTRMAKLECAHVFCFDCIYDWVEYRDNCPKCNKSASTDTLTCVKTNKEEEISPNDYGSKFISMYKYIINELERDPNSRIIIYMNHSDMANQMEKYLKKIDLDHARLTGLSPQRREILNKFRTSPTCRVMLTSNDDSVYGVHLPEATHLIFYHPFCSNDNYSQNDSDLEAEKAGINMITYFNANQPINVVYFVSEDELEMKCIKHLND